MARTWAPLETQKAIYDVLKNDNGIATLLGVPAQKTLMFSLIPTAGQYTLSYGALETAALDWDATAGDIQTALRLLEGLELVTVAVQGSGFLITFQNVEGVLETFTSDSGTLEASGSPVTVIISNVVQQRKVFDFVPDNSPYPYITLQIRPFTERGNHTKEGWASDLQINVWYQPGTAFNNRRGQQPVQEIQEAINNVLNDSALCVDGWNTIGFRRTFVDIITDVDNVTLHGIQLFNLLLGEGD